MKCFKAFVLMKVDRVPGVPLGVRVEEPDSLVLSDSSVFLEIARNLCHIRARWPVYL